MSTFTNPYTHCATPSCADVPSPWSRYCARCTSRRNRYGHVHALSIRQVDLLRHRDTVRHALASLASAPAVIAAHTEAERLLHYCAPYDATRPERELGDHMRRLRTKNTKPREIVQRVCEVFYIDHDGTFQDMAACRFALARQVLKVRTMHSGQPNARMLGLLGQMVHERFAVFALKLRKNTDDDSEAARQRRAEMLHGWTVDDTKAPKGRHKVAAAATPTATPTETPCHASRTP